MKPWGSEIGLIFLIFALNVLLGKCLSGIFGSFVIVVQLYSSSRSFHIFHLDSMINKIFAVGIMKIYFGPVNGIWIPELSNSSN